MAMNKTVLVTSIGSDSGLVVIQKLKAEGYRIIGCNCYPKDWLAVSAMVDVFYQLPKVNSLEYSGAINSVFKNEDIDFVLPLTDVDVDWFSSNSRFAEKWGCVFCQAGPWTVKQCRNKLEISKYCCDPCPARKISDYSLSEIKANPCYPYICKPLTGRSSEGIIKLNSERDLLYYEDILKSDYLIQPFISGRIFCADVVRHPGTGETVVIAREELLRTHNGAGLSVLIQRDEEIEESCIHLSKALNIIGCVNFEFIRTGTGELYLLECNPRFSGGIGFSCSAGYNMVKNHMKIFNSSNEGIDGFQLQGAVYMSKQYGIHANQWLK